MPSYNDKPPGFNEPSAADEIRKLIKDAIEVKSLLAAAAAAVRRVDSIVGTQFSKGLDVVDKKYVDLMNESRSSATTLNGVIQDFVEVIVPYSEMVSIALPKRVNKIKLETQKAPTIPLSTEAAARKDLAPYDEKLTKLKEEVKALVATLTETSQNIKNESDAVMNEIDTQIADLAAKIKAELTHPSESVTKKLGAKGRNLIEQLIRGRPAEAPAHEQSTGQPASALSSAMNLVTGSIGGLIGGEASALLAIVGNIAAIGDFFRPQVADNHKKEELDAKVNELANAKKEAREKVEKIETAVQEASKLADSFSGLDGRLGHFDVVWNKVLADSYALGEYIGSHDLNEQAMIQRVNSEAEVYSGLRRALDEFSIRVTV
ncbi:hypothetical protein GALMADRAFT_215402 [Galerina marginata CBS 339.88]|uniref:Uncharacterized protein n=1 Tax=Galerina marginata (strain CBS 339.88) TaxID=685588 RepID=A0A067SDV3_GALM3|nr:hypothetical protein GALMADRAFT_215402 [Galerina marginata CBS 339.88]